MTIVTVTPNTSLDRTIEVPGLVVGRHLKGRLIRVQPGGKGINVARCLAALGVSSVITGLVGGTELAIFRQAFESSPARVELVPTAQPTRTCTTLLDPELHADTHVREEGGLVSHGEIESLRARLEDLAGPQAIVVFCGSLPPGMADAHLAALIAACRARGADVALDLNGPQLRAALGPLGTACGNASVGMAAVKPNVEELGECLGRGLSGVGEAELVLAARSLLGRVGTILVTRGRAGALAVRPGEALAGSLDAGAARNTVGCGDAFLAGYLAALWRGLPLAEALRLAVACGAAQAQAEAPGHISAAAVHAMAPRVTIRPLH